MPLFKAIILAGGSGERFWPLSTPEKPKQFLNVFGGESLIRQTAARLKGAVRPEDVYVVTGKALTRLTRWELPELPRANIVGEPMRRDTAAAVALGVGIAAGADDPVLAFFPADQLVTKIPAFQKALHKAVSLAKEVKVKGEGERRRCFSPIVTIGIKPTFPATGYGYVDPKNGKFVEKPNVRKAKEYLKKGYLWNAGMFIARASVFRAAFASHAPELLSLATLNLKPSTSNLAKRYASLPKISFDYAIMEKQPHVAVVPADCGWDDVGGYAAFEKHFTSDGDGNVALGTVRAVESTGCTAVAKGAKIALLGVKDLVVVTTKDAVLVVAKDRVAELKKLRGQ